MHGRFNDLRSFMEDLFFESCVKRDHGTKGKLFPIVTVTALVIFMVFFNGIPIIFGYNIIYFTGMISFGLSYLVYRINKNMNIEYQIEITNDNFEVTKITNRKKMEMLSSFSIKECEYIGPISSDRFADDVNKADFTLNCTAYKDYDISDDIWYVFLTQDRTPYMVIFEFDEQMYPIFRRYNPRGTKIINV